MHTLPAPGGLLDQDHMFVMTLDWVTEAQDIREQLERDKASAQSRTRR